MMQIRISNCRPPIFLLHLLLAGLVSLTMEATGNSLIPGQSLYDDGTTLISSGDRSELGFSTAAGSGGRYVGMWHRNISQTVVWVANRSSPIDGRSGRPSLSGEGLTDPEATLFNLYGFLSVRESGNDDPNSFEWQSFDYPTDTLLPCLNYLSLRNATLTFAYSGESAPAVDLRAPSPGYWTTPNQSPGRSHLAVMIAVPALLAIFLLVCIAWVCKRWKRKNCVVVNEIEGKDLDLPLFDLDTVLTATSNLAAENKLGQGGFGPVYKGKLVDGQEIAVKRLSDTSTQGINEFKNEALIIPKLHHQNLIRLLGCCIQGEERMLIYEYMSNGSLDSFLFDEAKRVLLDWKTRYDIIVGIARGLLYLHHDSRLNIIHRDMKTSNILLDKDNTPKISDFGLARIFKGDEMEINTQRIAGTYGYMSPEYARNGLFSIKSDVFSFGVLILEIISGKKNREIYRSCYPYFLGHIWSLWKEGKSLQIVDESISHSFTFSITKVMRCIKIGLLCVQARPKDRPTMSLVVVMLTSNSGMPEPRQPGFVAATDSFDPSIEEQYMLSINDVSNTTLEGR